MSLTFDERLNQILPRLGAGRGGLLRAWCWAMRFFGMTVRFGGGVGAGFSG